MTARTFWAAPEIAKAGYKVFPVKGKASSVTGGFYAATTDPSQIAAWIEDGHGDHDIAIPTGIVSGVVVIDADSPETYAEMEASYGLPTVKTRRGGHWWFRHPRTGKMTSAIIKESLDRKGDSGYVVVPPSRGRTWTNGIPDIDALPPLPKELREEKQPSPGRVRADPGFEIPTGSRNATLTSIAGSLRRRGLGESAICAALLGINVQSCSPPLEAAEVQKIARSVARYEPGTAAAEVPHIGDRVFIGKDILHGIEPPDELVQDIILTGRVSSIYSGSGVGKTFLMLWIILRVIEQGLSVIVFDKENRRRIIAERLEALGADPEQLDKYLHYYHRQAYPATEPNSKRSRSS
jgi:hypothetical protein